MPRTKTSLIETNLYSDISKRYKCNILVIKTLRDWCYLFNLTLTSDNKLFFILLTEIMINDNNRYWKNNIGRIGRINTSRKTSYNVINPVFILTLLLHLTTYYVHYLLIGYFTILSFDLFCLFFAFILSSCYVLTL